MDKALKQRLVGAVVLIALAVIVLPMIFGGRPSATGPETRSIELPAVPPDLDFETRRFPVGEDAGRGAVPARSPGSESGGDEEESVATITPLARPADSTPDAGPDVDEAEVAGDEADPMDNAQEPAAEAESPAVGETEESMETLVAGLIAVESADSDLRYVVQVASFGSDQNAVRLASELEDAGYDVLLDQVSSDTGQLNRVRVGPYASEDAAQQVVATLQERYSGVNPRVVDMQPDEATPALASEDPMVRWIVQVGSFSSEDNARDLVARLRSSGLTAFDETLSTATSTIYRVRVGPYLDRAEALSAEQRIADEIGIDGVVMSAD